MTSDSVLERVRSEMGCCYLSDLHCLTGEKRSRMLDLLSRIPKDTATAWDWDDIWSYLSCEEQLSHLL